MSMPVYEEPKSIWERTKLGLELRQKYELAIFAKRSVAVMKFSDSRNPD